MDVDAIGTAIRSVLRDRSDLLKSEFADGRDHPLEGHCYVATEALYVALGGQDSDYTPCQLRHEGVSHWFLRHDVTGEVVDLTKEQFDQPVPYEEGRGRGFQKCPSSRAQDVLTELADMGVETAN